MRIVSTILVLVLVFVSLSIFLAGHAGTVMANANTPPTGVTGAPGEGKCSNAGCHVTTGGTGGVSAYPTNGLILEYQPGVTDTIGIGVANYGSLRWGFELTARIVSNGSMAGSFNTLPNTNTIIQTAGGKSYVSHTSNGATAPFDPSDGTEWSTIPIGGGGWIVEWTAPPPGSGNVVLYVAGVGADGDQTANSADTSYTFSLLLHEQGTPVTSTTWGKIKQIYR